MTDKNRMKKVVAIDGPSGSGKTTIAKLIARELGFNYLDTGALYRAVAISLRSHMIEPEDSDEKLGNVLGKTSVKFENGRIFLNSLDVSGEIRSSEIDHYSSVFSAKKIVRDFLLDAQRQAAYNNDLVVEGRDTSTVVFPDAAKKIFLDASVEERGKRRYNQFKGKGGSLSLDQAVTDIIDRDKRDASRNIAPLRVAPDALFIDSSDLSIEQVKKKILDYIRIDP
jgi:cytidylate kinase